MAEKSPWWETPCYWWVDARAQKQQQEPAKFQRTSTFPRNKYDYPRYNDAAYEAPDDCTQANPQKTTLVHPWSRPPTPSYPTFELPTSSWSAPEDPRQFPSPSLSLGAEEPCSSCSFSLSGQSRSWGSQQKATPSCSSTSGSADSTSSLRIGSRSPREARATYVRIKQLPLPQD